MQIFMAVSFIIGKKNEATKMVFHGKWINKLWYIHATEYYSTIRRNELSSYRKARQNLLPSVEPHRDLDSSP